MTFQDRLNKFNYILGKWDGEHYRGVCKIASKDLVSCYEGDIVHEDDVDNYDDLEFGYEHTNIKLVEDGMVFTENDFDNGEFIFITDKKAYELSESVRKEVDKQRASEFIADDIPF